MWLWWRIFSSAMIHPVVAPPFMGLMAKNFYAKIRPGYMVIKMRFLALHEVPLPKLGHP